VHVQPSHACRTKAINFLSISTSRYRRPIKNGESSDPQTPAGSQLAGRTDDHLQTDANVCHPVHFAPRAHTHTHTRYVSCGPYSKGKGKAQVRPKIGHEGPDGEQRYSSTLSLTSALGVAGQHHAQAALPLGQTRYPLYRGTGGPQGRSGRVRKISPPPGFDPRTVPHV